MLWGLLAGSVAAVLLVQETRRWLAQHSDALPIAVLAALWWLIKSLLLVWRASILFAIREVRSW